MTLLRSVAGFQKAQFLVAKLHYILSFSGADLVQDRGLVFWESDIFRNFRFFFNSLVFLIPCPSTGVIIYTGFVIIFNILLMTCYLTCSWSNLYLGFQICPRSSLACLPRSSLRSMPAGALEFLRICITPECTGRVCSPSQNCLRVGVGLFGVLFKKSFFSSEHLIISYCEGWNNISCKNKHFDKK